MSRANEPVHPGMTQYGLTIREHFAAMAMQGLLAGNEVNTDSRWERAMATLAVSLADGLIAELAKEPK